MQMDNPGFQQLLGSRATTYILKTLSTEYSFEQKQNAAMLQNPRGYRSLR